MRLCANENLPGDSIAALRAAGHDVLWVRETMPGATDVRVMIRARAERRILLTLDKDFGSLVFQQGKAASHGIILFRINQSSAVSMAATVIRVLASRADWVGHFSVVDDRSIRMRLRP